MTNTEIDILNSDLNNVQNLQNSSNINSGDLIHNNSNNGTPLSISKSREKRMTKLLLVGIILPFSVLLNIQSSEIPAWYNKVCGEMFLIINQKKKKKKKKKKLKKNY